MKGKHETELFARAAKIVDTIYRAFLKEWHVLKIEEMPKKLSEFCMRLVLCLYVESAYFSHRCKALKHYLESYSTQEFRGALIEFFRVLDTPLSQRNPYLNDVLAPFPYIGGLWDDVEIPEFNETLRNTLLRCVSENFSWNSLPCTVFGSIFESISNPTVRRREGMHYTSVENIHKVIDPLFLDDLKSELEKITNNSTENYGNKQKTLKEFQSKLSSLTFLDPACGSGNFLAEAYVSLRRLENSLLSELKGNYNLKDSSPIMVSPQQFYGIEIDAAAVTAAKITLWIAENQMLAQTRRLTGLEGLTQASRDWTNIYKGNALRLNWAQVRPAEKISYIIGNPPFIGYSLQSREQKADILALYTDDKGRLCRTAGKLDYVAGWYWKAAQFMQGTSIHTAFVSTKSITQGEQATSVWKPLYELFGVHINFAHRTFRWDSESNRAANVHCVIIGFSCDQEESEKVLYGEGNKQIVSQINPYLTEGSVVFIENRAKPLCNVAPMSTGNRPADGGFLIVEDEDYPEFVRREPQATKYIKRLYGSEEFIKNKKRWCLWLTGITPDQLERMPLVKKRVEACRRSRLASPDQGRRKLATTPWLFRETQNPERFLIVPKVSTSSREYIPMDFGCSDIIATDLLFIIVNAGLYEFGILESSAHMAWMRAICGRLGIGYRYSANVVYNNFPWPSPLPQQRTEIEQTAQAILKARALYPERSLSTLYNTKTMPAELKRAHQANDRAVMAAYGFPEGITETTCTIQLMKRYQELTHQK